MKKYRVEVSTIKRIRSADFYIVEAESKEQAEEEFMEGELEEECPVREDLLDQMVTNVEEI